MINGVVEPRRASTAAVNCAPVLTVIDVPPVPPRVPPLSVAKPTTPGALPPLDEELEDELEELELLEDDEELELLLDELLELDEDELLDDDELDELLELDELDDEELELELEEPTPPVALKGIEHSFTPPATRVPAPKVASEQAKVPLSIL
jgi:hypothetical protein